MTPFFIRSAVGAATAALSLAAAAQGADTPVGTLSEVTVTGTGLVPDAADRAAPDQRLDGERLLLRSQGTLGETLDGLPGVSATHFGPNVSRPVVRGLEGDRVPIMSNGGASLDVSGLSFDHAVAADAITVDRIEVLRGPAALLYGGNAGAGVVNVIDGRIPRAPVEGLTGRADASHASGNREAAGAVMLEGGNTRNAVHVDAFVRDGGDARVPHDLACTQGGVTRMTRSLCNTASLARGAAVGASTFFDQGYLGASVSSHRQDYGSAAEADVTLGMRSDRVALEGLWRPRSGPLASARLQAAHTDYRHTEFEDGTPGTVFSKRGEDARLELRHRPVGGWSGVFGLQAERSNFSAQGDEAFAPGSHTRMQALFVNEAVATGWGHLSLGARHERVEVESLGNPAVPRFATGSRSFSPTSLALGALWNVAPAWQLTANLSRSERAPRDYELFANGPHLATGAWEVGDAALGLERSNNADLALQWKQGHHSARAGVFVQRFSNYLALQPTGVDQTLASGEVVPEYAYVGVPARLQGLEASGNMRLRAASPTVDLEWKGDLIRATRTDTGEPLPRIAPLRAGATLVVQQGPWGLRLGFDANARQDRVPVGERETAGYTLWNAALTWRNKAGPAELLWYARVSNLTDKAARSAASILTQTAPDRAWLQGRSVRVGVRADF